MYIPYFSKYFDRKICQSVKGKIIKESTISYELFDKASERTRVNNKNKCRKEEQEFTPDKKFCYRCNEKLVGMNGCNKCSFSLERKNVIKCEGKCSGEDIIESSEVVCSHCSAINKGCNKCHYEDRYPDNYKGIKRKRRFVCDHCEGGYVHSFLGTCLDCNELGLHDCNECKINPNNNESYICTKCEEDYFVNENGNCEICDESHFKGINISKCIDCGNIQEGGIDKCLFCESDGEKPICKLCVPGYIL